MDITREDAAWDEPEETREIPPVQAPGSWDYEADVAIVGGGGAGLCAAALRNGASVIILEKQDETGGHSQHAGAAAVFNIRVSRKAGLEFDREAGFKHAYGIGSNATVDLRLLSTPIDRSHEVYDWSETQSWGECWKAMNLGFIPDQGVARMIVKGSMPQGPFTSGTQLVAVMYSWMRGLDEHVREQKGTILAETAAKALVCDSGRIGGVKAEHGGGETCVRALGGLILAGSSFTNNRVMIKKYCPWVYERAVGTFLPPIDTGEVVRMGLGAGADLACQDSWTCFAGGIPFYDTDYTGKREPGPWFQYLRQGYLQVVRNAGWLEMNANCEEFLPEGAKLDYEQHPKTITGQPGHRAYVVFDSNYQTTLWQTLPPPMLDDRPMTLKDPEYPWFDKFAKYVPKDYRESVRQAIDGGGIKVADSLPELGKQLGLDPERLKKAVQEWNGQRTHRGHASMSAGRSAIGT